MTRAVVFAYHQVGVACLQVLLDAGIEVALVVTHADSSTETIWFDSVEQLARQHGLQVVIVDNPNTPEFIEQVKACDADFLFSFYYRQMLSTTLLATAKRGAFNMHGSLLPKYRGRVPINWAIIKGETETGATLHEMVEKPDAGRIVDQQSVAILPNDDALAVFNKVVDAAKEVLTRSIGPLVAGTAVLRQQNLAAGSYFGGRKPQDGIINWQDSAQNIHNLVRAVAPPWPGAITTVAGLNIVVTQTELAPPHLSHQNAGHWNVSSERVIALCGDGRMLRIRTCLVNGEPYSEVMLAARLGNGIFACGEQTIAQTV